MTGKNEKPLVIAVIPARGGSKGVPRKNVKDLCGKPLIAYTIEVAKAVPSIDHVVVSTEDEEIAEVAKTFGAFVPFLRPRSLAQDNSSLSDVLDHMHYGLKDIIKFTPQYVLISMFVTSPFRNSQTIHRLVEKSMLGFHVKTAKKICKTDWFYSMQGEGNMLSDLKGRGDEAETFFKNYGNFLSCPWNYPHPPRVYHHVLDNPIELIDIDNFRDFYLAEEVIRNRMYDFGEPAQ